MLLLAAPKVPDRAKQEAKQNKGIRIFVRIFKLLLLRIKVFAFAKFIYYRIFTEGGKGKFEKFVGLFIILRPCYQGA